MIHPHFINLYVDSPENSATFYEDLLGVKPVNVTETYALFVLPSGMKFGLWAKKDVMPTIGNTAPSHELVFSMPDVEGVDALHTDWQKRGIEIIQAPTQMDFGYTFTAVDPDGYRMRVYKLSV